MFQCVSVCVCLCVCVCVKGRDKEIAQELKCKRKFSVKASIHHTYIHTSYTHHTHVRTHTCTV